ncbi:MAG: F0F1 ATP synthase subunit A [Pirellulales bacterium]
MADDPLHPSHLFGHVQDAKHIEVPRWFPGAEEGKIKLPQPLNGSGEPIVLIKTGFEPLDEIIQPVNLQLTKFMVLEVVAAVVIAFLFIRLANRLRDADRPRGVVANLLEAMVVFIREQVARPAIGKSDADRFVPFLLTMFFFVLACNLLGMLPWCGSPTGALGTTGALAMITFVTVVGAGVRKFGPIGYWKSLVPHMDLPGILGILLKPMIFLIEVLGLLIKHFVLAVRLLANMMAGHLVLAVIVAFVAASFTVHHSYTSPLWVGVTVASIFGALALSLLELFVAFLQAFIFVFLSALFIGMTVHPH